MFEDTRERPVETGLFWLSSRYYSPELCRFISPDDIEYLDPESVNGLNLYCYCGNDPVNNIDPSGHAFFSILIGTIVFGIIMSVGTEYVKDVSEKLDNGFQMSDLIEPFKDNYKEYIITGLKGAVIGAA